MKNLRIDALRTFVKVVDVGGFTQAGELLGRSQPAVSLQVKSLETMMGQLLLNRNSQYVDLTTSGQAFFDYAKKILDLNDEALGQLDNSTIFGKVRLGIPSEFATTLLPKIVGRFIQAYPKVILEVHSDLSRNLLSKNQRNQYDVILALNDDQKGNISDRVKTDELVWVASHKHDTHLRETVPVIAAFEGCIYRRRAINTLNQCKRPWRLVYTIPDLAGIQAAIEQGLGVTVLARSTVPENLKILKHSRGLPSLGKIDITLTMECDKSNQAVLKMFGFLRSGLATTDSMKAVIASGHA